MINTQMLKINHLLIIAGVDRVAPGIAHRVCRPLGIDLAGAGASRCDRNELATLIGYVLGDTRPTFYTDRGVDCDDTLRSW